MRISNSFSEGEIQVLDFILTTLLRGGTPTMAVRNKDFASLCRKVVSMKNRVAAKKAKGSDVPEQSSVGQIEAPSDAETDDLQQVG